MVSAALSDRAGSETGSVQGPPSSPFPSCGQRDSLRHAFFWAPQLETGGFMRGPQPTTLWAWRGRCGAGGGISVWGSTPLPVRCMPPHASMPSTPAGRPAGPGQLRPPWPPVLLQAGPGFAHGGWTGTAGLRGPLRPGSEWADVPFAEFFGQRKLLDLLIFKREVRGYLCGVTLPGHIARGVCTGVGRAGL